MFNGEKISLRSLELTDIHTIMKYWNDLSLRRDLGFIIPDSKEEREEWIRQSWELKRVGKTYRLAIENLKTHEFLGHCSLNNINQINRTATASIAIYNIKEMGKGYGTDAMKVLLRIGFDYLNLHRIGLNVFETNRIAIHVYEKIGFKKVGTLRETDYIEGVYVNDVVMDILENEWREMKK